MANVTFNHDSMAINGTEVPATYTIEESTRAVLINATTHFSCCPDRLLRV